MSDCLQSRCIVTLIAPLPNTACCVGQEDAQNPQRHGQVAETKSQTTMVCFCQILWMPMVCSRSFCFHVTPKPTCSTEPRRAVRVLQQVLSCMRACIVHIFEAAQLQEMAGGCTITPLRGVSNQARASCQHCLYHHVCLSQPDHGTH